MISVDDERALVLRRRVPALAPHLPVNWKTSGILAYLVFFLLTSVGVAAMGAFCALLKIDVVVPGILAVILGELLIRVWRWWATGVEAALWLGGLFTMIFSLEGGPQPEALLLFAAACAIAGVRVRQPLFGAAATIFVLAYLQDIQAQTTAFAAGIALTLGALLALTRTWKRPSTEWLWIALLLVMPVAAYITGGFTDGRFRPVILAAYAALAIVCLVAGVAMRHHAPLIAAAVIAIVLADQARHLFAFPAEVQLAVAGFLLLAAAWLVARALRDRTSGLVVTPEKLTPVDDELQLVAAVQASPGTHAPAEPEGRVGGGGGFGGAGATGDY